MPLCGGGAASADRESATIFTNKIRTLENSQRRSKNTPTAKDCTRTGGLSGGKTPAFKPAFLDGNCTDRALQLAANLAHLGERNSIEKRERNGTRSDVFGHRQRVVRFWQIAIRRLQMDGSKIPSACDSLLANGGNNLVSMAA